MKRILFVFPTAWDRRQLAACRGAWEGRYAIDFAEPADEDCPSDLDILDYIDATARAWEGRVDGVTSSSDYPGATVAGAVAERLGLPGCPPATVVRCSHKYYSRVAQREAVPEATAGFRLVDPALPDGGAPDLEYPCFVKPVKGAFSIMSGKLTGREDLAAFLARPDLREFFVDYMGVFNRLVAGLTDFEVNGSFLLAEEFLHGQQVTVEGWARGGEVGILGVVDSVLHPGVPSFARFDHPSGLRAETLEGMADVARRAVAHLGLTDSLFNIEMIYDPSRDRVRIVEINPRMCGQFADLYEKVDGVNSYAVALALAAGDPLPESRGGRYRAATSFPLRVFSPVRVAAAPAPEDVAAAEALHPGTLVWSECQAGQTLADFASEDGHSSRYAVVNLGADSRRELLDRLAAVESRLGYVFAPLR